MSSREPHQVVLGLGHVGVVGSQLGLVDLQGSAVVVLHLVVLALVLTQQRPGCSAAWPRRGGTSPAPAHSARTRVKGHLHTSQLHARKTLYHKLPSSTQLHVLHQTKQGQRKTQLKLSLSNIMSNIHHKHNIIYNISRSLVIHPSLTETHYSRLSPRRSRPSGTKSDIFQLN